MLLEPREQVAKYTVSFYKKAEQAADEQFPF